MSGSQGEDRVVTVVAPSRVRCVRLVDYGTAPYGDGDQRFIDVRLRDGSVRRDFVVNIPVVVYAGRRYHAIEGDLREITSRSVPRVRGRTEDQALLDALVARMRTARRGRSEPLIDWREMWDDEKAEIAAERHRREEEERHTLAAREREEYERREAEVWRERQAAQAERDRLAREAEWERERWIASVLGDDVDLSTAVERFSTAAVAVVTEELERREGERCTACDTHHDDIEDGEHVIPERLRERLRLMAVEVLYQVVETLADAAHSRASRPPEVAATGEAESTPTPLTSGVRLHDTIDDGPGVGGGTGVDPGAVSDERG